MVTGKGTSAVDAVDAVEQAVELLAMLGDSEQELSVSALSRKAGISRYKMVRLLASLEKSGVAGLVLESGRYDPRLRDGAGAEALQERGTSQACPAGG